MAYRQGPRVRALLAQLKDAKDAARVRRSERAPTRRLLARSVRRLQDGLKRALATRERWRSWHGWTDEQLAGIHKQDFHDLQARIASLPGEILTAEIALALFDQEYDTCQ